MSAQVHHGCCLVEMRKLIEAGVQVDAVVTDPPAGIAFMNRDWDKDKGGRDKWIAWMQEVADLALQLTKPGGHALVWALPRTSHWTATAWENAGWTVRDRVSHLFGVGFPKSLNVSVAIDEHLFRRWLDAHPEEAKRLKAASAEEYDAIERELRRAAGAEREVVGIHSAPASSLGDTRCMAGGAAQPVVPITAPATDAARQWEGWGTALKPGMEDWWLLRKPLAEATVAANVLAHGTGALNVDACRVATTDSLNGGRYSDNKQGEDGNTYGSGINLRSANDYVQPAGRWPANVCHDSSDEVLEAFARFGTRESRPGHTKARGESVHCYGKATQSDGPKHNDTGSAARFFYSAKASATDRAGSKHPTVKPVALMRWLVRLITPPGGTVLDPFAGSGTTGQAALEEGFRAILIEREAEYIQDIINRIDAARDALAAEKAAHPPQLKLAL